MKLKRKSIRLQGWDYANEGAYFITICVFKNLNIFGEVNENEVILSKFGQIVYSEWERTALIRENVVLDEFVVMPNHIHGILFVDDNLISKKQCSSNDDKGRKSEFKSQSNTLGAIIRGFKASTATKIKQLTGNRDLRIWHRNYFDRIIRNETELENIRNYIFYNPIKWKWDKMNPENINLKEIKSNQ